MPEKEWKRHKRTLKTRGCKQRRGLLGQKPPSKDVLASPGVRSGLGARKAEFNALTCSLWSLLLFRQGLCLPYVTYSRDGGKSCNWEGTTVCSWFDP